MNPKQKREYWQVFNQFQQSREKKYAPALNRALLAQKKEFIDQYKAGGVASLNPAPLRQIITDLYYDAAIVFGAKVLSALKTQKRRMPIGFNERMQQLIEQYYGLDFLNLSEGITETTRELLMKVLIKSQEDGLGFDDIIQQLERTELSRKRARLIARTETVTAANSGAYLSAKESGILVKKVWIETQDARTRHSHKTVTDTPIDLDEPFNVGGYLLLHPGARKQTNGLPVPPSEVCNCRCVIANVPQRDAAGRVITT